MKLPLCGSIETDQHWLHDATHRAYLQADAQRQFDFFSPSLRPEGGF